MAYLRPDLELTFYPLKLIETQEFTVVYRVEEHELAYALDILRRDPETKKYTDLARVLCVKREQEGRTYAGFEWECKFIESVQLDKGVEVRETEFVPVEFGFIDIIRKMRTDYDVLRLLEYVKKYVPTQRSDVEEIIERYVKEAENKLVSLGVKDEKKAGYILAMIEQHIKLMLLGKPAI